MRMAPSGQAEMQCSSLPQVSGKFNAATPSHIVRDVGPHASTHSPQPEHSTSRISGTHLPANSGTPL